MRGHNASLASKNVTLPSDQSWVKLLDDNPSRMYATWEFSVAPINAVWAKVNDAHAHDIEVVYDD